MSLVSKGWGSEFIWESNDLYCGKFLNFKEGARFSMHFHKEKDETWYVLKGKFLVKYIDTKTSEVKEEELGMGATWRNKPLEPHQQCKQVSLTTLFCINTCYLSNSSRSSIS